MYVPLSDGLAVLPLLLERFASLNSVVVEVVEGLLRRILLVVLGSVWLQLVSGATAGGGC